MLTSITKAFSGASLASTAIAAMTLGVTLTTGQAAQALELGLVEGLSYDASTGTHTGESGAFEVLVPRSPGVYGLETRGGYADEPRRTWEMGVGTHTSSPGNFNQGEILWLDDDEKPQLLDFFMEWVPGEEVTARIGDVEVSYDADWQVGNAIEILVKRQSYFLLEEADGVVFNKEVDQLVDDPSTAANETTKWTNLFLAGDSLLDGWSITGKIGMLPHERASYNQVIIKPGTFTGNDSEAVPEPAALLGLLAIGAVGAGSIRRRQA